MTKNGVVVLATTNSSFINVHSNEYFNTDQKYQIRAVASGVQHLKERKTL